jgi:hypothetical protein
VIFAFILPGYAVFLFLSRRREYWKDAAMWLLPLAPFVAWLIVGVFTSPDFYQQVVLTEFFARFDSGDTAVHVPKPVYAYVAKLVPMFFPWSLALFSLPFVPAVRRQIKAQPELIWLVCWVLGGLVVMSLVPSKRADRIFPIIPPACLLLAKTLPFFPRARTLIPWIAGVALVSSVADSAWMCVANQRSGQGGLVTFGRQARSVAHERGAPLEVVRGHDEGMLLYAGKTSFISAAAAHDAWRHGTLRAVILPESEWMAHRDAYPEAELLSATPKIPGKGSSYVFIGRATPLPDR